METLSNYHKPKIIHAGMMRRKIGPDGIREKNPSEVDAPIQNNDYSNTYYQINKSNQIEAPYVLGKQRKQEVWLGAQVVVPVFQYDSQ